MNKTGAAIRAITGMKKVSNRTVSICELCQVHFLYMQYYLECHKYLEASMNQYEFTLVRYDLRGLMADTVVCAGRHEIQHLLDDGWHVVMSKPADADSSQLDVLE